MSKATNPYAVLGLPSDATEAQIDHAYRCLVRRHHPDTRSAEGNGQAAASDTALQLILSAYAILGDPARRARYDQQTRIHKPDPAPPPAYPSWIPTSRIQQRPIQAGPVRWQPSQPSQPSQPPSGWALRLLVLAVVGPLS
jgi:curved DNA-binding protein CbpA